MARIRSVKPEFFRSRTLNEVSVSAQRTFIGLWCVADDEGRYRYEPALLRADVWPLAEDVTARQVDTLVTELERVGVVCRYETAGKTYLHVVNWHEHQKISRPSPSKLPECSVKSHGALDADLGSGSGSGSGKGSGGLEVVGDPDDDAGPTPDVEKLCRLLADEVEHNTGTRPKLTQRGWYDPARLMLTRDNLTVEQVEYLIHWSQNDEFWRSNILSMSKLREKQQTLIAQARRQSRANAAADEPAAFRNLREL